MAPRARLARTTAILCASVLAAAAPRPLRSGLDPATFDPAVRPQDDLFGFVNGTWLASTAIPPDRVFYSAFQEVNAAVERDLHAIVLDAVRDPARRGRTGRKVADLYGSLMDDAAIERAGVAPARPQLERLEAIRTAADLAAEAGRLSASGNGGPFDATVGDDPRQPGGLVVQIRQGGTLLPDRDHYLSDDARYRQVRAAYEAYLTRIFTLAGRADAPDAASAVVAFETALANAQWSVEEMRDPSKPDARLSLDELHARMPGFDWRAWARPQGIDRASRLIVSQPSFFARFAALVAATPIQTLKAWLTGRYLTAVAPFLPRGFADARFEFFGRLLTGQKEPNERWRRGVSLVSAYLGDAIGRMYVERRFPPASRAHVEAIVRNIVAAYRQAVVRSDWLSASAKDAAVRKLERLTAKVGYPDAWRSYGAFDVRKDDLLGNVERGRRHENLLQMAQLRGAIDPRRWLITPQTVNAYYATAANEIVVPAAILQPPFYDADAEDAVNYGAIGAIIAHEIGHALDDQGRFFDGSGRVRDWWTAADREAFVRRAAVLVEQFNGYEPVAGTRVDGVRTLRENAADLAGLAIACDAYRLSLRGGSPPIIDGYSGDQRLFLAWARMWRSKERAEYLPHWVATIPHAPSRYRANGIVGHLPAFYEAFGVTPRDALFREPARRVRFW